MSAKYNWFYNFSWSDLFGYFHWTPRYAPKFQIELHWQLPETPDLLLSGEIFSANEGSAFNAADPVIWYVAKLWILGFHFAIAIYLGDTSNNETE